LGLKMGEQRKCIIMLTSLCILTVFLSETAFATSENWIEVARFYGGDNVRLTTDFFTCDHSEWRIRWELDIYHGHFPELQFLSITTYPQGESNLYADLIYELGDKDKNGTSYVHNNIGNFYMRIETGAITKYSVIVEQNLESPIPEFPSWIIPPMILTITLFSIIVKRKLYAVKVS